MKWWRGPGAFVIYSIMAKMFQARCVEVPFKGHTHDLKAMLAAITPVTKLVFVANPNNPTGTRVADAELDDFIRRLPPHVIAVLDEAYIEFLDGPPPSIKYALKRNVIVLRTFSKIVGLAGVRIGYGVAQKECIALLQRVRQPFNTNAVGQAGALAALGGCGTHIRKTKALTRRRSWLIFTGNSKKFGEDSNTCRVARTLCLSTWAMAMKYSALCNGGA